MSELTAILDKNDTVVEVKRTGDRWRFKRLQKFSSNAPRKLTIEQEQEICAMYVDRPNLKTSDIASMFGGDP